MTYSPEPGDVGTHAVIFTTDELIQLADELSHLCMNYEFEHARTAITRITDTANELKEYYAANTTTADVRTGHALPRSLQSVPESDTP